MKSTLKEMVQEEILAQLNELIDNELETSKNHLTVAEIVAEVLLTSAQENV